METKLPYRYKRKSKNFFEWLLRVGSVHYHIAESVIIDKENNQIIY